jgi:ribonuclease R
MLNHEQLLKLIRDKVDHPATPREILQRLKLPRQQRPTFKKLLAELVESGALVETRGNRFGLPDRMNLVVGKVVTHPRGFGFVVPDQPLEEVKGDVFIAGSNLNQAMHGDRVVARIERISDNRAEGRILRILERGSSTVVGRFDLDGMGLGFVVPFDRRLIMDVSIPPGEHLDAKPGDMVVVEVTRWPTPARGPLGRVVEALGDIDEPGVDNEIIIRKYGIPDAHSEEAVEEARRIGSAVRDDDLRGRTDFRPLVTVTIDGEHARDFDDAITIEKLPHGNYWLGVHIADVAHYVREESALDGEAFERGTSVYFPDRAVHMFPSELSTGLCSLNPQVDRLVQSCLMEVDRRGTVLRYELHDGVIHSNARMTYTDVNAILTDRDPDTIARYTDLVPLFEAMHELFGILNKRRHRRGSIDFDLKQAEIVLDDEGMVEAIVAAERNVAHRIIEEFMLLANETVAQHLDDHEVPTLYRIHEEPDPLKVAEFEEFVTTLGYSLAAPPGAVKPRHFQKLVEKMRGTPEEKPIAFLMLRTMQKARYDDHNLGHFGLAAESYTHFTSPIRRYPDLVVHRTLRESRHGLMTEDRKDELTDDLPEIARHTSERERRADDAERELVQWKKVRFMADKVGDEFDGYITGVTAFGLFIELIEHFVEGLVHVSTMADDYYRFVERAHILQGENTGRVFRLGDRVTVQVIKVDMERRQIDLGLSEILDRVRESEKNRGPRRSRIDPGRKPIGGTGPSHPSLPRLPRRSDSFAKAGRSDPAVKAGRSGSAAKAGKRRAQRPGRKERSVKRGKPR